MDVDGWRAYNLEKWAKVEGTLLGLSFSQTSPDGTTFILGYSAEGFGEQRVIVGRMARVVARPYLGSKGRAKESGYIDEEIVDGGENVSHSEIAKIIECWRNGKRYEPPGPVRR